MTQFNHVDVTLMCRQCFDLVSERLVFKTELMLDRAEDQMDLVHSADYVVPVVLPRMVDRYCEICKKVQVFDVVDTEIAPILQMLNLKGFITEFSCAGHEKDKYGNVSFPYIKFANSIPLDVPSLPASWRYAPDDSCRRIIVARMRDWDELRRNKYLYDIAIWAYKLDNVSAYTHV